LLRNPYYIGIVSYEGVQYQGRHEPLIDFATFETVQRVLTEHDQVGERPVRHHHYLKGTIFCGTCGGRLGISHNRGNGGMYSYFYCISRQHHSGCTQPYLPMNTAETLVEDFWLHVRPSEEKLAHTRAQIEHHVDNLRQTSAKELRRQQARLDRLTVEERKLLQAHYSDAVSLELLQSEQQRIASERNQAAQILGATQLQFDEIEAEVDDILNNLGNGYSLYRSLGQRDRRTMNRSVFERLWITEDGVLAANLTPGYAHVVQDDLGERLDHEAKAIQAGHVTVRPTLTNTKKNSRDTTTYHRATTTDAKPLTDQQLDDWLSRELVFSGTERPYGQLPAETRNPDAFRRQGSNEILMVELMGRYSNPDIVSRLQGILAGHKPGRLPARTTRSLRHKQAQHRLDPDEVARLIDRYRAGTKVSDLAVEFHISRTTVMNHVERVGIPKRRNFVRNHLDERCRSPIRPSD